MDIEGKTPLEFAKDWYRPDDIHRSLNRNDDTFLVRMPPTDTLSMEFAEWLCHEYQLAMMKGIDIAERTMNGQRI